QRASIWLREDPATVLPLCSGVLSLARLALLVPHQQVEQFIRQRDRSTAGLGLDVHLHESPALSLRAHMSMLLAVWRARFRTRPCVLLAGLLALFGSVVSRSAGVRIGASVLPRLSLQCFPDT